VVVLFDFGVLWERGKEERVALLLELFSILDLDSRSGF
jgi:hypothetical protein